jgi:hypothetical protein
LRDKELSAKHSENASYLKKQYHSQYCKKFGIAFWTDMTKKDINQLISDEMILFMAFSKKNLSEKRFQASKNYFTLDSPEMP